MSERTIRSLLKSQSFRCALTGRELTPPTSSLDHKRPVTRGGEDNAGNVWLVHRDANQAKGTMTAEEFIALCHEVVQHHRRVRSAAATLDNTRIIEVETLPLFQENPDDQQ